jgi:CrcB protein
VAYAFWVGLGGFFGSAARFSLGSAVQRLFPAAKFPYGTLSVNLLGCFAIGVLAAVADGRWGLGTSAKMFLLVGVLGGFTTFSSFAFETLTLGKGGATFQLVSNVALHFAGSLVAVWLGDAAGRWLAGS